MTYLVITDNLIDHLDDLEINELKYEKIKSDEISNSTNVSLFSDYDVAHFFLSRQAMSVFSTVLFAEMQTSSRSILKMRLPQTRKRLPGSMQKKI